MTDKASEADEELHHKVLRELEKPKPARAIEKLAKSRQSRTVAIDDTELREQVWRFCRTKEAADNLVSLIAQREAALLDRVEETISTVHGLTVMMPNLKDGNGTEMVNKREVLDALDQLRKAA